MGLLPHGQDLPPCIPCYDVNTRPKYITVYPDYICSDMEYDNRRHNQQFNKTLQKDKIIHFKCKEARGTGWLSMNGLCLKNKQMQSMILKLPNIAHLYLSGCSMEGTVPSFENLPRLQVLDLSDNDFDNLTPRSLIQNKNLTILDLSMNKLILFPPGICHSKTLRELNLAQNDLVTLPEDMDTYHKLEILDVSYNLLRTLPDTICEGHLKASLKKLRLRNNVIANLPERFGELSSLEELDLRENDLSCLPHSAESLKYLQVFHHVGNRWTLPPTVGKFGFSNELLESSYGSQAFRSLCELLALGSSPPKDSEKDTPEKCGDSSVSNSLHS